MGTVTTATGASPQVRSLLQTLSQSLGTDINLGKSKSFRAVIESLDGRYVNFRVTPLDQGAGYAANRQGIVAEQLAVSASGALDFDGAVGTAVLVSSTVAVTVTPPADGGVAVPAGSSVYATVTTPGGNVKRLTAVRTSDTQITVSSPGSGYAALLETAGVDATLIAGTIDATLANVVGDRLAVVQVTPGGTPGILSVKRKSATEVTVESWVAGTGLEVLDTSDVKVYNFGQAAHETSTVRYAVIRP